MRLVLVLLAAGFADRSMHGQGGLGCQDLAGVVHLGCGSVVFNLCEDTQRPVVLFPTPGD
jgi:hypothetical protein